MMDGNGMSVERRLARVEARHEIADLVSAYVVACDDRDLLRLVKLFTPDGLFQSRNGMTDARGRQAILELYKKRFEPLGPSYHWTHDHSVTFDEADDDHARGLVLGHVESFVGGVALVGALRYEDFYVRHEGKWLFAARMLNFFYMVPVADYPQALGSPLRMRGFGQQLPADYPETLESWTSWRSAVL